MATEQEITDLNAELSALNQVVRVGERGDPPVTYYQLCKMEPIKEIEDIIAFGEIYGVTIAP